MCGIAGAINLGGTRNAEEKIQALECELGSRVAKSPVHDGAHRCWTDRYREV